MSELLLRFAIGGIVVSAFAIRGDLFKPSASRDCSEPLRRLRSPPWR